MHLMHHNHSICVEKLKKCLVEIIASIHRDMTRKFLQKVVQIPKPKAEAKAQRRGSRQAVNRQEGNDNKLSSDEQNEGGNEENNPNDDDDEDDDNLILLTFTFSVDPKLSILPQSFLNFFLRTAIHQIWGMFLDVATEVCDGKRPEHSAAIARKRVELYDWVEERTRCMLRFGR